VVILCSNAYLEMAHVTGISARECAYVDVCVVLCLALYNPRIWKIGPWACK